VKTTGSQGSSAKFHYVKQDKISPLTQTFCGVSSTRRYPHKTPDMIERRTLLNKRIVTSDLRRHMAAMSQNSAMLVILILGITSKCSTRLVLTITHMRPIPYSDNYVARGHAAGKHGRSCSKVKLKRISCYTACWELLSVRQSWRRCEFQLGLQLALPYFCQMFLGKY